jgi:serine/threonine protein kinase
MEYKKLGKSLRLKEKIGEGAFGEVYRGCIRKIKMDVAIKMEPVDADP